MKTLSDLYIKPKNEVFAHHLLVRRLQEPGERVHQFLQVLKGLSIDCNFKAVSNEQHKEKIIRDVFINGLSTK